MFKFVNEKDEFDDGTIKGYKSPYPSLDEMRLGREKIIELSKNKWKYEKLKVVFGYENGRPNRMVVVSDSKEFDRAKDFCENKKLVPLSNYDFQMILGIIDNMINGREKAEMAELTKDLKFENNDEKEMVAMKKEEARAQKQMAVETQNSEEEMAMEADRVESSETGADSATETTEEVQETTSTDHAETGVPEAVGEVDAQTAADNALDKVFEHGNILEPEATKTDKSPVDSLKNGHKAAITKKPEPPIASDSVNRQDAETKARLLTLSKNPIYEVKQDKNGHFIIAESRTCDMKLMAYGEGGRSDLTCGLYVYAKSHGHVGKAKSIKLSNVMMGGTALTNFMADIGLNVFTMEDISVANKRLWKICMFGKLNMLDLEPKLDAQGIHSYFMKKIAEGFNGLDTMTIYAEKISRGSGKGRYDIGIWQDAFDAYWEEIADETDIDKRAWLKQAKALGWLLPDKGRGGGQHTPSIPHSKRYGRKETDRIQRFAVPYSQASEWMKKRDLQRMVK
jgi:hypothetical protein